MSRSTKTTRRSSKELATLERSLRAHGVEDIPLLLVLGSGLGSFGERIEKARAIPYTEIEGMPQSGVPGHAGKLVVGEVAGVRVVAQSGRVHLYEGWDVQEVTRAVRAFRATGCRGVFLSNAAGGLHADWPATTLMRITDHINMTGSSPIACEERGVANPYDEAFGEALERAAKETDVELKQGVYAGLLGPSYETPAEVRHLQSIAADAVGMSTVCEALAAHAAGMQVAAISCITNLAAGIGDAALNHDEVMEAGEAASDVFCRLLERAVPYLEAALPSA